MGWGYCLRCALAAVETLNCVLLTRWMGSLMEREDVYGSSRVTNREANLFREKKKVLGYKWRTKLNAMGWFVMKTPKEA